MFGLSGIEYIGRGAGRSVVFLSCRFFHQGSWIAAATAKLSRPRPQITHRPMNRGAKPVVRSSTAAGPSGSPNRDSAGTTIFTSIWKTTAVLHVFVLLFALQS